MAMIAPSSSMAPESQSRAGCAKMVRPTANPCTDFALRASRKLAASAASGGAARALSPQASLHSTPQAEARQGPVLQTFEDLVALIDAERDIALKLDVERFVRPISFRPGVLEFEPAPGAPANLAQRLVGRLKSWTGQPWLVAAQGGGGAESLWERQTRETRETRAEVAQDPFVLSVLEAFPGAEVVQIRNLPPPEPALIDDLGQESGED